MLKMQEQGLYITNLTLQSPFAGFLLGIHNEQSGAKMARPVMVLKVATNPSADETFGIGTKTYTFKASGATGNQINLGISATLTRDAIIAKINLDTASTGVTAYSLQGGAFAILVSNTVGTVPAYTPPAFTADGVKVVADVAWANVIAEAKLESESYFKIALTDPNAKPVVLGVHYADGDGVSGYSGVGTWTNFLY